MKMGLTALVLVASLATGLFGSLTSKAATNNATDVSWPNCSSVLSGNTTWGIIGVNGGLDFRSNQCLATESSWFSHYALYINTGYPGRAYGEEFMRSPHECSATNASCLAYNYGYNATLYAISYANKEGVHSNLWWLDVETENSWTANPAINRASLQGALAALVQHTFLPTVGFYSYPAQWESITGSWHNNLPSWVATGGISESAAAQACLAPSFTGGSVWLSQYVREFDKDYICSSQFTEKLAHLS